ncbi:hypothetical protein EDB89DRAFT_644801 [Lactarius sanguifluus]|nr:hypothetical protein EDB89DRAFT_644801 [Lactarius sanguifluus]
MRKVMRLEDKTLPGRPRFGVSALQTDVQRDEGGELCRNAVPDAVPTVGFGPRTLVPGEAVDKDWKSKKGGSTGAGSLHSKTSSCARVAACGRTKGSAPTDGWKMSPRRESAQRCGKCSLARENPDEARIGVSLYRASSMRVCCVGERITRGHPRSGPSRRETCVLPRWGLRARIAGGATGSSGRIGMRVRKGPKCAGCPGRGTSAWMAHGRRSLRRERRGWMPGHRRNHDLRNRAGNHKVVLYRTSI